MLRLVKGEPGKVPGRSSRWRTRVRERDFDEVNRIVPVEKWRLAAMMALLYAVQGAFWPVLAVHLGDLGLDGRARGWIFATLAMGSAIVPLGAGQLVDWLMPTQRVLALAHALGMVLLAVLASGLVHHADGLFLIFLAYWMIVAPSSALCSSLAMRHLDDPGRQFGGIRLWGTIGWMTSGWLVSLVMAGTAQNRTGRGAYEAFLVATLFSMGFAAYALTLPHTPPLSRRGGGAADLREGLKLLKQRDVLVFLTTSFGVSLTTPLVYQVMPGYFESRGLSRVWLPTVMTISQWSEIATLAVLPLMLRRLGYKGTLGLGIAAWFTRFLSLSVRPPLWFAIGASLLHGLGVGCFTVGGQVYLDSRAPSRQRASAQGLYVVLTAGLASLVGNLIAGELERTRSGNDVLVFLIPCMINGAMLIYLMTGFRSHPTAVDRAGASCADCSQRPPAVRGTVACLGSPVTESADG
jgi:MFS family permease